MAINGRNYTIMMHNHIFFNLNIFFYNLHVNITSWSLLFSERNYFSPNSHRYPTHMIYYNI